MDDPKNIGSVGGVLYGIAVLAMLIANLSPLLSAALVLTAFVTRRWRASVIVLATSVALWLIALSVGMSDPARALLWFFD